MSKQRSRVLVVDDEEEILRAVGRALVINGYDVETAADGTTAHLHRLYLHSITTGARLQLPYQWKAQRAQS